MLFLLFLDNLGRSTVALRSERDAFSRPRRRQIIQHVYRLIQAETLIIQLERVLVNLFLLLLQVFQLGILRDKTHTFSLLQRLAFPQPLVFQDKFIGPSQSKISVTQRMRILVQLSIVILLVTQFIELPDHLFTFILLDSLASVPGVACNDSSEISFFKQFLLDWGKLLAHHFESFTVQSHRITGRNRFKSIDPFPPEQNIVLPDKLPFPESPSRLQIYHIALEKEEKFEWFVVLQHQILVFFESHRLQLLQIMEVESIRSLLQKGDLIDSVFVHELD